MNYGEQSFSYRLNCILVTIDTIYSTVLQCEPCWRLRFMKYDIGSVKYIFEIICYVIRKREICCSRWNLSYLVGPKKCSEHNTRQSSNSLLLHYLEPIPCTHLIPGKYEPQSYHGWKTAMHVYVRNGTGEKWLSLRIVRNRWMWCRAIERQKTRRLFCLEIVIVADRNVIVTRGSVPSLKKVVVRYRHICIRLQNYTLVSHNIPLIPIHLCLVYQP